MEECSTKEQSCNMKISLESENRNGATAFPQPWLPIFSVECLSLYPYVNRG